jgi:hypothetical protein
MQQAGKCRPVVITVITVIALDVATPACGRAAGLLSAACSARSPV